MTKKSERRQFMRSPLSWTQSLPVIAAIHKQKPPLSPEKQALADQETLETPTLADVETQKMPVYASSSIMVRPPTPAMFPQAQYVAASQHPPVLLSPPDISSFSAAPEPRKRKKLSKQKRTRLIIMAALLFIPTLLILFELVNGFIMYRQMQDGIAHLQAIAPIFRSSSSDGTATYFDAAKLRQAQAEVDAAHADFVSLNDKLGNDGAISLSSHFWPVQINTVRALGQIAVDGTAVAQELLKTMVKIAPSVAPALQKNSTSATDTTLKPYLNTASYQEVMTSLDTIAPLVHRMALSSQNISLDALPISSKQRDLIASILPALPTIDAVLAQRSEYRDALGWFIGIDAQRTFLVEPMDTTELRATGGFTGQFGELTLNGGHVGPLKLSNIGKYEEDHTSEGSPPDPVVYPKVIGQAAPAPYSEWWPVGNFGLRDANLSADFPTSASIIMDRYSYEFGTNLDGVIVFTPALIKQVLHITGPISIPAYHQIVTEQNLESLLHYYQLDNAGIAQEVAVEHVYDGQIARKLFTQRVATTLIATVTHLPLNQLLSLAGQMFRSMKSKDLQVYVTNPQLEALIGKYGSTASMDRSTTHDGFFVVQSNLSASKASQYVKTSIQDTITLDAQGGATHSLQLTLDYQQGGDVYGFDTYRDYVRIYVPETSQLLTGNGFDRPGKAYCGDAKSAYPLCQPDVYGDGSLICTPPIEIGYATSYLYDPYAGIDHPLDLTGLPPNLKSDESGLGMFGGWVVIPKNCTAKVTVSWYVPPMSQQAYSLLVQAQSSVYSPLDITIQPASAMCAPQQGNSLHFSQVMNGENILLTVKRQQSQCSLVSQ